ncbi:MAG TPA: TonB-dependent receptor [Flavobacteriaceae bacterium]|nr:TonB-dependent receptor [Flavobacteriaceae bacterium]
MKQVSVLLLMLLTANLIFSQNDIEGSVVDNAALPLPGADVYIKGTDTGTETDFDGNFSLNTDRNSGVIVISYIGFKEREVSFNFDQRNQINLGQIQLEEDADALEEVVIIGKGVIDLAKDRKTPIAVSTITRDEIQLRAAGNVEFPDIVKNTPNTYISNESSGFGDSQIFVRGFDQSNTAFLFNGQPINDMTNGKVYWSNWSGLSDIVNAVQMQRGLGSSKLAISSVGGTMNMVTKTTAKREGGFARFLVGNDSYMKTTVSYDTGVNENGWGFSFLLDHWQAARKYAKGTKGEGQVYFFSVGKELGRHNFNLLLTGAPQQHSQNFAKTQEDYDYYGRKYNDNYGFRDGKYLSERVNYYHKPILNLNWDWDIEEDQNLSTVLYASIGAGGGTGTAGDGIGFLNYDKGGPDPYQRGAYTSDRGLIDWDFVQYESNAKVEDGYAKHIGGQREGTVLTANVNNHYWFGGVTNYQYDKIENLSLNIGADLRFYRGDHFQQLRDKLGLKGFINPTFGDENHTATKSYTINPWKALFDYAPQEQRVNFDYSEDVNYQGVFGQAEYATDDFSVFVQGSVSNQSYQREDRGNFAETKTSEKLNKTGYNIKGGAAWNITNAHSIFVNAGKYSRQPFNNSIFDDRNDNTRISDNVNNEEILGFEAGYRFDIRNFQLNLNAYHTDWKNRFLGFHGGAYDPEGDYDEPMYESVSYHFMNIAQLHKGLELDVRWRPSYDLTLKGYITVGNWQYDGTTPVKVRDNDTQDYVDEFTTNLENTKIGQAPQTSGGLGITYQIIPGKFRTYANWNYYGNFYGYVDATKAAQETLEGNEYQPAKLNSYSLMDLGASYTFQFDTGRNRLHLGGNIYNLLNHQYVSQQRNEREFYFGNGRTFNMSVRYTF